jgi:hypothetical protein
VHCASVAAQPRGAKAAAIDTTKTHRILFSPSFPNVARLAALLLEHPFNLAHLVLDLTAKILGFAFKL